MDPVFSGNAAPFSFLVKAFPVSHEFKAEDIPIIDYLVLTHYHYDHLDFKTIRKLKKKIRAIFCSLGISAHLKHWGIDGNIITEMDWWQTEVLDDDLQLTAAPARHFSGRGLKRGQTLWSSFILRTPIYNIYLGGDSGYDEHFKMISEKYRPFDLAILESGQYNSMWSLIHMMPEETVKAAIDLKAKHLLPVHWGKFRLGMHPWDEPIRRIVANLVEREKPPGAPHLRLATPRIGEPFYINRTSAWTSWWQPCF